MATNESELLHNIREVGHIIIVKKYQAFLILV